MCKQLKVKYGIFEFQIVKLLVRNMYKYCIINEKSDFDTTESKVTQVLIISMFCQKLSENSKLNPFRYYQTTTKRTNKSFCWQNKYKDFVTKSSIMVCDILFFQAAPY